MTREELARDAASFDRAVLETPDIDGFCSSSHWILPAAASLMPPGDPFLFRGDHGYFAAMVRRRSDLRAIESLEAGWGLACPLVGARPDAMVEDLARVCRDREREWDLLLLTGIPVRSELLASLLSRLAARYRLGFGPLTERYVASLEGGLDGFLGRRSRNLRRGLDRARRRAAEAGIEIVACDASTKPEAKALYARILDVERRTWKGRAGVGIDRGGPRRFYAGMIRRLAAAGLLRTVFARHEGQDVGYLLGAVWDSTYRGLQFGFDDRFRGEALGNVMQHHQIRAACQEGLTSYDLGTGAEYKHRWAESTRDSIALLALRR